MVVVEQEATRDAPEPSTTPSKSARKPGAPWSSAAQFRRSLPLLRLLADIWAIPQVNKIGLLVDGSGTYVHVLMPEDDRATESRIYEAERRYLNETSLHNFDLMVTQLHRVPDSVRAGVLSGMEIVLER
jgi:hypothetical protein